MQLAMIGLGRMGGNMTERLMRGGHSVVAYDRDPATVSKYQSMGAEAAKDLAQVVGKLSTPRIIWIMVPAGKPVDDTIDALLPQLSPGDILIDGGNSMYKDTRARAERLASQQINFNDAGTSGGVWGL
jgi:6-phosphogluconate dehydrogenase